MHMPRATKAILVLALLPGLLACGPEEQDQRGSLIVTTESNPGASGEVYIEGARQEIALRDQHGDVVGDVEGDHSFAGLAPGTYTLDAGQRPCSGNCGQLDPLTDQCSASITVRAEPVRVHIDFRVGAPCRITGPGRTG